MKLLHNEFFFNNNKKSGRIGIKYIHVIEESWSRKKLARERLKF